MIEVRASVELTGEVLTQAAQEILERMFFLVVDEVVDQALDQADLPREDSPRENLLATEIQFHGEHSGCLRMVVRESCASELAANFTGMPDPGQLNWEQVAEVLRELTNMMCGTTLSRLAPQSVFELDPPVMLMQVPGPAEPDPDALARRLKSGNEWIDLYWRWQAARWEEAM
jgi:CheY-specific phosphatase CheX